MARRGKNVIIDDSVFQKKARALAKRFKVDEYDFVKEQTGLLARDVAKYTPPFAIYPSKGKTTIGSKQDLHTGIESVRSDILQIVYGQEQKVINWAIRRFGTRPTYRGSRQTSKGVLLSVHELRRWHEKNRRANGKTRPLKAEDRHWVSYAILDNYIDSEIEKVGISKAAFARASLALGAKGSVPAWVKRHLNFATGFGRMANTSKGPYGVVRGSAPGLWHVFPKLQMIQRDRLIKAVKRLERIGKDAAKKAGYKVI